MRSALVFIVPRFGKERGTGRVEGVPGPSSSSGSSHEPVPRGDGWSDPYDCTLEFDRPKQVRAYYKPFRKLTNGRMSLTRLALVA